MAEPQQPPNVRGGPGRRVRVVAPTKKAADVAHSELGVPADSVAALVYAYGWRWNADGVWTRLASGDTDPDLVPPGGDVLAHRLLRSRPRPSPWANHAITQIARRLSAASEMFRIALTGLQLTRRFVTMAAISWGRV